MDKEMVIFVIQAERIRAERQAKRELKGGRKMEYYIQKAIADTLTHVIEIMEVEDESD